MDKQTIIGQQRPKNLRQLKPYLKMVDKINALEDNHSKLSDDELQSKTVEFKNRLASGETILDLAVEAFATVREASKRVLGMRHFDVQLLGGLVLLHGNISEMKTGEGKTLVASLPSYLIALEDKGVHVITVNDYLARRDMEQIGQIHQFLGLTVGLNIADMGNDEKKTAYLRDITYGVGTEFGFDYLRDNMVHSIEEKVQRPYHYAIIDEVDSVLIDEAKTPLIIAGKDEANSRIYKVCASVVKNLKESDDYSVDRELKVVHFTDDGIVTCEKTFGVSNLFDMEHSSLFHSLLQALRAYVLYHRDIDYIVEDDEIKLIDMNTGRVMEGRSLSDGLHQAIESKEGVPNTDENKTHAAITIQNYFRMYPKLSGMTGTAKTEEEEIRKVYGMDVINIPPNKTNLRMDEPDQVFLKKQQKHQRILEEIQKRHEKEQPILIGTASIQQSEEIAELLNQAKIDFQLLNAKNAQKEAGLIALAGQKGKVTIATNMAGRGTDIILGEGVAELGGLHVLGTERNDSERIDNQLKGRSARQGDPGSTQFVISLEDHLTARYASEEVERMKPKLKTDDSGLILSSSIHKFVENTQKICEGIAYQFREYNLKLEGVLNSQREVIYQLRDGILQSEKLFTFVKKQNESLPDDIIDAFFGEERSPEEVDLHQLANELDSILLVNVSFENNQFDSMDEIKEYIAPLVREHEKKLVEFDDDEEIALQARLLQLSIIDSKWKAHLDTMQQVKDGIGIRQYQQEDPIQIYEKEGYALFESLFNEIKHAMSLQTLQMIGQIVSQRSTTII